MESIDINQHKLNIQVEFEFRSVSILGSTYQSSSETKDSITLPPPPVVP